MRKDAALQIFAKGLADIGLGGVVVALAVALACAGEFMPSLEVLGDGLVERAYVRGGAGCRVWVLQALARPRVNASALGVQWRAWGSASVGWVPDDTGGIYSVAHFSSASGKPIHS